MPRAAGDGDDRARSPAHKRTPRSRADNKGAPRAPTGEEPSRHAPRADAKRDSAGEEPSRPAPPTDVKRDPAGEEPSLPADATPRPAPRADVARGPIIHDVDRYPPWIERFTHATFVHEGEYGSARAPLLPREHHQWTPLARSLLAVGDQWTLLIISALADGPPRLAELRARLPGISAGVLNRHLQQMLDLGLVSRQRHRELPPRVEYQLTRAGRELLPVALALSRWGLRNLWTRPQPREHIAIGEIFRLLPELLADERLTGGPLELAIDGRRGKERHVFALQTGRLIPIEPGQRPGTRMSGEPFDWVEALGPRRNYAALQVTGDLMLAKRFLKALLG